MLEFVVKILLVTTLVLGYDTSKWVISENPHCLGACPLYNEANVHLPHMESDKFCQCVWGKPIELHCPSGTHFNPRLGVCVWRYNVEPKLETSGCIGTCPDTKDDYLLHKDHTKYCRCQWGVPSVIVCPSPLEFNPHLKVCDLPAASGVGATHKCYDSIPISNDSFKFDFGFYKFRYHYLNDS